MDVPSTGFSTDGGALFKGTLYELQIKISRDKSLGRVVPGEKLVWSGMTGVSCHWPLGP